jgi:ParB family transcriptional regulator, chromosome partitioning protein
MSKKVLGKGIGALFTDITELQNTGNLLKIDIDLLKTNPYQPRKEFNLESLTELSESIKQNGIIQPIIAEPNDDGTFTIIAGERRVRAARIAGLLEIPVIPNKFTIEEKLEIALVENIQREDLTPLEEAYGYKNIIDILNLNQEEVAKKVGKNRSTIANALRLLKLPDIIKDGLKNSTISAGHARAILSLINPIDQELLYKKIIENNFSVREAEKQASQFNSGQKNLKKNKLFSSSNKSISQPLQEIIQKFIDILGTKVEIKGTLNKGKIEITYFSTPDLERIIEIINK